MSFSSEVKGELARLDITKKCCMLAEIAGFLRVSSSIRLAGGGKFSILASTENAAIARHYKKLIEDYFNNDVALGVGDSQKPGKSRSKGHNRYYLIIEPDEKSSQILRETGMMLVREGNDYFSDGVYAPIVKSKCCKKSFVRGLFLGCGTMSDPRKAYHLELVFSSEQLANDVKKLVGTFVDLSANIAKRKESYIVYMKKSQYISDMLGILGADDAVLEFEDIRLHKSLLTETQRMMNCDSANMDRALSASEQQIAWIKAIDESIGLDAISPTLREVAEIRLSEPEASLTEIGEALTPPIKKPAVSKRFAKIKTIAESL